jgi:hypothetical protein
MSEPSSVLVTNPASSEFEALLSRAVAGDEGAFALFNSQRERLRRLVRLRLDRRLSGRIDDETALLLGLTKKAASNRYIRALRRLKEILSSIPGMNEGFRGAAAGECLIDSGGHFDDALSFQQQRPQPRRGARRGVPRPPAPR